MGPPKLGPAARLQLRRELPARPVLELNLAGEYHTGWPTTSITADAVQNPDGTGDAYRLLARLFEGVRRLHRRGVYHGALDPDNILVVPSDCGDEELCFAACPDSLRFPYDIAGTRMARQDLLSLTHALVRRLRFPSHRVPLEAYGLDEFQAADIVSLVYSFRRSRARHRRLRWEFVVRSAAARLADYLQRLSLAGVRP